VLNVLGDQQSEMLDSEVRRSSMNDGKREGDAILVGQMRFH
jgi:hypothetical protein